jgi:tellurite methyltransferase
MSMDDWDTRYREGKYNTSDRPHDLLVRFSDAVPRGRVIDIAAGSGSDLLFLAERGYTAVGLDRSEEALRIAGEAARSEGLRLHLACGDASALPFRRGSASGVIVFYFLIRDIMGQIVDLLEKGGILIYETFLKRQNLIDRERNPDYLLEDGELFSYFRGLDLLFYEETIFSFGPKKRAVVRYVGRKR